MELVPVSCAVVDANGAPVLDLSRDEFQVYDNGARRILESFSIDTDAPLTLGVIVDNSESQQDQLAEHRRTALDLIERILRPGDHVFVISVNQTVRLWDMAQNPGELFGDQCPASTCGGSPLWNAIYDAARLRLRTATGSKALLLLTDGFDSGSPHTWRQAVDEVHRADAAVYAIQYPSASGRTFAPDLYRIVIEAAGTWFRDPHGDYSPIVSRLESDLRRRYVLTFRPEQLTGRIRHDLRIEVTRPGLTVRSRKTYFRDPQ